MKPIYLPFGKFTAVGTPHVLHQSLKRTGDTLVNLLVKYDIQLVDIYEQLNMDQCHWLPVHTFLLYLKKKYNRKRRRYELEMISLTPSKYKKTKNRDFAEPIEKYMNTKTAFPIWFGDYEK